MADKTTFDFSHFKPATRSREAPLNSFMEAECLKMEQQMDFLDSQDTESIRVCKIPLVPYTEPVIELPPYLELS